MAKKQYIRIVRKCKNNVRVELKDHSTVLIPIQEVINWECVESNKKIKENNKKGSFKSEDRKEIRNIVNKKVEKQNNGKATPDSKVDLPKNIIVENPYFLQTKHTKSIVGIDPSYTRTGIAILTKDGHLIFHTLSEQIGKKDFIHTYNSAHTLAIQLQEYLSHGNKRLFWI